MWDICRGMSDTCFYHRNIRNGNKGCNTDHRQKVPLSPESTHHSLSMVCVCVCVCVCFQPQCLGTWLFWESLSRTHWHKSGRVLESLLNYGSLWVWSCLHAFRCQEQRAVQGADNSHLGKSGAIWARTSCLQHSSCSVRFAITAREYEFVCILRYG
jgi:hypothetical protein